MDCNIVAGWNDQIQVLIELEFGDFAWAQENKSSIYLCLNAAYGKYEPSLSRKLQ